MSKTIMCSHKKCLMDHWVRLTATYPMALEPEQSEMRAAADAILNGSMREVECVMNDDRPVESVSSALKRIQAKGRPPQESPPEKDPGAGNRRLIGFLHPPKRAPD